MDRSSRNRHDSNVTRSSVLCTLNPKSNTYEQEKDYINALKYCERALSILPVFERSTHDTKLARLKEQAEDARAHVIRTCSGN
jgi:hypothetical protein